MGFKKLQEAFQQLTMDDCTNSVCKDYGLTDQYLYFLAGCLFEIAGNLDTLAVEMREQTKIMKGAGTHRDEMLKVFKDGVEKIVNPPMVLNMSPTEANIDFRKPGKRVPE